MMRTLISCLILLFQTLPSFGAAPKVVTDIPPIYSLVAAVMQGVSEPTLLLDGAGSPHDAQLRPSKAADLQAAELVVYVSKDLSPSVTRQISALTKGAQVMELISLTPDRQLPITNTDHHDHDHDGHIDPHAWLDVVAVQTWVQEIATSLAALDPENAKMYLANSLVLASDLKRLQQELDRQYTGAFIAYHDGMQYFGRVGDNTGLPIVGFIKDSEASAPSARHLRDLGEMVLQNNVTCILAEPGYNPDLVAATVGNGNIKTVSLDILGQSIERGPTSYLVMMRGLSASIAQCEQTQE